MDDWVFLRVLVAEVADDGLHVGIRVVEQLYDLRDAQFVEVNARPARFAAPSTDLEESLHQLFEEWVGDRDLRREMVRRVRFRIGDPRRKQAVGNRLCVHVGEAIAVEIVDQGLLERLHELGERAPLPNRRQNTTRSKVMRTPLRSVPNKPAPPALPGAKR